MLDNHVLIAVDERWKDLQRDSDHHRLAREALQNQNRVERAWKRKFLALGQLLLATRP